MTTCSWCGSDGPFATITVGLQTASSSYCTPCTGHRERTGTYPPRTPEQKLRAISEAQRRHAARTLGA